MEEGYGGEEESMIPKGLLDVPCEKSDDATADRPDIQNQNIGHYSLPCFIAIVSPEQSNNMGGRYQYNSVQCNETNIYPSLPQQIIPHYNIFHPSDYFQHQRNARMYNVIQQQRQYQDMEYPWLNYMRPEQSFFPSYFGSDIRPLNNSRNNNTPIGDRIFIPLQPIATPRYPFEYQQKFSAMDASSSSSSEAFQNPNSKTQQKTVQTDRESQTDQILTACTSMETSKCDNERKCNTEESSTSTDNYEFFNTSKISTRIPQEKCHKSEESNIEKHSFRNVAYYGCLGLEKLLVNASNKISNGIDLTQFCVSLMGDLTKSKSLVTNSTAVREMVFAFLQICYCWVSLKAVQTFKHDKMHVQEHIEKLKDYINIWEKNSKMLLENLITVLETIPLNESSNDTPVIKILKNNLNKTKNIETETPNGLIKKRYNESESNYLNYNWRRSSQNELKRPEKNETIECTMCQLLPENHRSFSESKFICDNFMKSLKYNQEKNQNKMGNCQRYTSHKSKQSLSPRGRFTIPASHNYTRDSSPRNDSMEKMFPEKQKRPKVNFINERDNYMINSDFFNLSKINNTQKSFDENQNQFFMDKNKEKQINNSEETTNIEIERSKNTIPLDVISAIKKELEIDGERDENTFFCEKRKGKRYSQQCKKKTNFSNHLLNNQSNCFEKTGNGVEISSRIKLKLFEILVGIQTTDFKNNSSDTLRSIEESKLQQSLIDPINNIAQLLVRNSYKTLDEIVGTLLSKFYQAKYDNKGNMALLTMANQLETKIMNNIYSEIETQ